MKKTILIIVFIITVSLANAHPHIFTGVDLEFVFNETGLSGLQVEWHLDDMTSELVLDGFDQNKDDMISREEAAEILKSNQGLKDNNYYFDMKINGHTFIIKELEDFHITIDDIYVVYNFFVPLNLEVSKEKKVLRFEVYDKTYYSAFYLNQEDGVHFKNAEKFDYEYGFYKARSKAYYYGQVVPDGVELILRGKK